MFAKNHVLKRSRFLRVVFICALGLCAITFGARALGQSARQPTNPFSDFADVFPGQPDSAILAHPFICQANSLYGTASEKDCKFIPADGLFSSIRLMANHGSIIQITFAVRDGTLQIGDLCAMWKVNAVRVSRERAYFYLPDAFVTVKTKQYDGNVSLFLAVRDVSFADQNALGVS
jgi:hypothetical protein